MFEAVILAAGLGTRLGRPHPKPLTRLGSGETILRRQIDLLRAHFGSDLRVTVVVGFKLEQIVEAAPDVGFVYNPFYDTTNTNRSLARALELTGPEGVLWLNGDVVFDPAVLVRLDDTIGRERSCIVVNTAAVADEEVKYVLDDRGMVRSLSKRIDTRTARGEALGINFVSAADKPRLARRLLECSDEDYFERGIELAIERDGLVFEPVDVTELTCVEVDEQNDLDRVNASFATPVPGSG